MRNVEQAQSTTTKPDTTSEEWLNAIGDSLSDLESSEDEEDREDEVDDGGDTELGKRLEDDEPGWEMGTISKTVQHRMESIGRRRWGLRNSRNRDGGTQPTTSVRER